MPREQVRHLALQAVVADDVHTEKVALRAPRHARGAADHLVVSGCAGQRHHDAFPCLPRAGDAVLTHVGLQRVLDTIRDPQKRELAQRTEVSDPEVVAEGSVDLLGRVDVAVSHPALERLRAHVDELDLIGTPHYRVGHRLALDHAGDAIDDVVHALEVLDVHGRDHFDARREQLLDVLPALLVGRSRHVAVRELVDEHGLRTTGDDRVDVDLFPDRDRDTRRAAAARPRGRGSARSSSVGRA